MSNQPIMAFLNQKGGCFKSTLARSVGVEFERNKWAVFLAELDYTQKTVEKWQQDRVQAGIQPCFKVKAFSSAKKALAQPEPCNLLIVDGAAYADTHTLTVALAANLTVIPTGITKDDLRVSIEFANELISKGVDLTSIVFVVVNVPPGGDSEAMKTRESIKQWGFTVISGWIPTRTGYGQAISAGKTLVETKYKTLNKTADKVIERLCNELLSRANQ